MVLSMLPDPGGREPAPEPLRAVQLFVNTLDLEHDVDELTSVAALRGVLARAGVLRRGEGLREGDLRAALEVREALRALLLQRSGVPATPQELAPLDRAADAARLTLRREHGRVRLVPQADGLAGALGRLLAIVQEAEADGTLARLKACPRDACRWVFYDRSRNASGKWCAASVCGNRTNVRRYRRRLAAA